MQGSGQNLLGLGQGRGLLIEPVIELALCQYRSACQRVQRIVFAIVLMYDTETEWASKTHTIHILPNLDLWEVQGCPDDSRAQVAAAPPQRRDGACATAPTHPFQAPAHQQQSCAHPLVPVMPMHDLLFRGNVFMS